MNEPGPPKINIGNQSSGAHPFLSFGELFDLHYALEETISAAAKDDRAIHPGELVQQLLSRDPHIALPRSALYEVVLFAAARAGVRVRLD